MGLIITKTWTKLRIEEVMNSIEQKSWNWSEIV